VNWRDPPRILDAALTTAPRQTFEQETQQAVSFAQRLGLPAKTVRHGLEGRQRTGEPAQPSPRSAAGLVVQLD
jgi:hypothetical protein